MWLSDFKQFTKSLLNSLASLATHTSKGLGTNTVPDPVPGNGALKEWREKRRFTTEDQDLVSLPQRNVQFIWQI